MLDEENRNRCCGEASANFRWPKIFGGKCLTLGEQQYFCLERRFSKHKMARYAKNFGGMAPGTPLATPMSRGG